MIFLEQIRNNFVSRLIQFYEQADNQGRCFEIDIIHFILQLSFDFYFFFCTVKNKLRSIPIWLSMATHIHRFSSDTLWKTALNGSFVDR